MAAQKLTEKQKVFVQEYLIDLNASQAAIRAGYSEKTSKEQGCQLLTKLNIQEAISRAQEKRAQRTQVTADRVIQELARLAFVDIKDFYDEDGNLLQVHEMSEDARRAISGIDIDQRRISTASGSKEEEQVKKIKITDKKAPLEMLGRHLGIFQKDNEQVKPTSPVINVTCRND